MDAAALCRPFPMSQGMVAYASTRSGAATDKRDVRHEHRRGPKTEVYT